MTDVLFKEKGLEGIRILKEDWWLFEEGTPRENIWAYFDKLHSEGIQYLNK